MYYTAVKCSVKLVSYFYDIDLTNYKHDHLRLNIITVFSLVLNIRIISLLYRYTKFKFI